MKNLAPLSNNAHDVFYIIDTANLSDGTKQKYRRVVMRYLDDGGRFSNPQQLTSFATTLPASGRAHLKAAIRLWSNTMIERIKGSATPENIATVQATIYRFEALQTAVSVPTPTGEKAHIWLGRTEVTQLMDIPTGNRTQIQRDRLALTLLVGAGLRRTEAVNLTFKDVTMQSVNGRFRTVLNITGKGAKNASSPFPTSWPA